MHIYLVHTSGAHILGVFTELHPLIVMSIVIFFFGIVAENQRTVVDFGEGTIDLLGVPDGMSIDADGKLWIACYGVGKVVNYDLETGLFLSSI